MIWVSVADSWIDYLNYSTLHDNLYCYDLFYHHVFLSFWHPNESVTLLYLVRFPNPTEGLSTTCWYDYKKRNSLRRWHEVKKKKNREVKNINQGEPEENEDGEGVQRQKVGRQQWKQRGDLLCDLIVRVLNTVTAICYFTACLSVMTCLITTYTNNTAHYCRCFLPLTHMHTHTHTFYNTDKRDNTAHYCLSL